MSDCVGTALELRWNLVRPPFGVGTSNKYHPPEADCLCSIRTPHSARIGRCACCWHRTTSRPSRTPTCIAPPSVSTRRARRHQRGSPQDHVAKHRSNITTLEEEGTVHPSVCGTTGRDSRLASRLVSVVYGSASTRTNSFIAGFVSNVRAERPSMNLCDRSSRSLPMF